jgi:hypothetical protein
MKTRQKTPKAPRSSLSSNLNRRAEGAISLPLLMVAIASAIIIVLAGVYIGLTLPGSLPTATTTQTFSNPTTTDITPSPNPSTVIPYSLVYIPSGSALRGQVANFNPNNITVVIGVNSTVVWRNLDNATHSISSTGLFSSPNLNPFSNWNYTFTTPGTYEYSDPSYTWMNGTIIVVQG